MDWGVGRWGGDRLAVPAVEGSGQTRGPKPEVDLQSQSLVTVGKSGELKTLPSFQMPFDPWAYQNIHKCLERGLGVYSNQWHGLPWGEKVGWDWRQRSQPKIPRALLLWSRSADLEHTLMGNQQKYPG